MRTTLKKGRARGDDGRGDGRVARPGGAPPGGPLGPVTRYGRGRRGPLRFAAVLLGWLLVALLVAAGALAGGTWLYLNKSIDEVRAHSPDTREAQKSLDVALPGKPAVALVIGYDKRAGADRAMSSRSDTIMLVRADPENETIALLSFPRDLVVDIPACRGNAPFRARINEAFTECGSTGTLKTVRELTGIPINYLVTVNFRGFKQIVDKVGGVYLDIDHRYFNDVSGPGGYATIDLHPGYQKLSGRNALDFVRFRHTDSDFYRIQRQQEFVTAFKQQVATSFSITRLPGIINVITDNLEVGSGGGKAIDVGTVLRYAKLAYGLPSGNFFQVQIDPSQFQGEYELSTSESSIQDAVRRFLNPDAQAAERAAAAATGKGKKKTGAPPPRDVTIEVLNGNGSAGSADDAAVALGERGYQTSVGGNADNWNYFETKVLYTAGDARGKAAARAVANLFGDGVVEPAAAGDTLGTTLRVIVGQTFEGTLGPGPADTTPEHEPPAVVPDGYVRPLLADIRGKAHFPLLVPKVRAESSTLAQTEPVRAYRLGGGDAVRISYQTGIGDYYGIQEMQWTDPPVLASPSVTRTIGGRDFRLYFHGSKLHLVAFEQNGAVYWVVNTLMDRLSNETMLAIAKGLEPLG